MAFSLELVNELCIVIQTASYLLMLYVLIRVLADLDLNGDQ